MIGLILAMAIPAGADHDGKTQDLGTVAAEIDGCNHQEVGESDDLYIAWTSAFKDDPHSFIGTRNGDRFEGEGAILEVNVQWAFARDTNGDGEPDTFVDHVDSNLAGVPAFRGSGLTPPHAVEGDFVEEPGDPPNEDQTPPATLEMKLCPQREVDGIAVQSHETGTFYFQFTSLHLPGRRPEAKGNAEMNVFVNFEVLSDDGSIAEEGSATLGTNLHVLHPGGEEEDAD